ncbi:sce7726 family protein [Zhihengliuella halotolerans]|uniref:sce7726 family protein n=1 Tax=Zhihengliuella halotolerans TaxID=370736 RepID=UPI0011AF6113|nr:sce7726 family protein [Zhihengliuella halotolerans]
MRDIDVREALHSHLLEEHASERANTRFVDELEICGEVRVDVAVLNGHFTGYELKSQRDTLTRLPKQASFYSRVFDYAVLVVAENHREPALEMIPRWWGVTVASTKPDGTTSLAVERPGTYNEQVDPGALVRLLWREETLEALTHLGLDRGVRSKPKRVLWDRLASSVAVADLRELVRQQVKSRTGWKVDPTLS